MSGRTDFAGRASGLPAHRLRPRLVSLEGSARAVVLTSCLVFLMASTAVAADRVLILLSEKPGSPGGVILQEAIETALTSNFEGIEISTEVLDTTRFSDPTYDVALANMIGQNYAAVPPALTIAVGEPALAFAVRHRIAALRSSALLTAFIDERMVHGLDRGSNVSDVYVKLGVVETVGIARAMMPRLRKVLVVGGASRFDQRWFDLVRDDLRNAHLPLEISYLAGVPLRDALGEIAALDTDTAVLYVSMAVDGAGVRRSPPEVLRILRRESAVPIFGLSSTYIGAGMVGGYVVDFRRHGADVGRRAVEILRGAQPKDLPPLSSPGQYVFDWRELQRFGIAGLALPAGAVVEFRPPGLWAKYKWATLAALALTLMTLLVTFVHVLQRKRSSNAIEQSDRLKTTVLTSMNSSIVILDCRGVITEVNDAWKRFGLDNGVRDFASILPGASYRRACEQGVRDGVPWAAGALAAVDSASAAGGEEYEFEYRADSGVGERWFSIRVASLGDEPGGAVLVHRDITQQKLAERVVRTVSGRLIAAQEDERRRIARDLHDDIGQRVALLAIEIEQAAMASGDGAGERIRALGERTADIAIEIHRLSHALHSAKLDALGLVAAVRGHCREVLAAGLEVDFSEEDVQADVPADVALCMFRVVQESLNNVLKHGGVNRAEVHLRQDGADADGTNHRCRQGFRRGPGPGKWRPRTGGHARTSRRHRRNVGDSTRARAPGRSSK